MTFHYSRDARHRDAADVKAVVHRHAGSRNRALADDPGSFEWPEPPEWRTEGLCRDYHLRSWFPSNEAEAAAHYPAALAMCMRCPVRVDCATYAIDNGERHGMWGGTTPRRRTQAARRQDLRDRIITAVANGTLTLTRDRQPKNKPPRERRPYMTEVRRQALERRRAVNADKRTEALRLWTEGSTLTEVAARVEMNYSTVKWWINADKRKQAS